jgi:phage gpG-like protein
LIEISLDFSALREQIRKQKAFISSGAMARVLTGPVLKRLRESVHQQFEEGGSPDEWMELRPSTILRKRTLGMPAIGRGMQKEMLSQRGQLGPENILIRQGQLRSSLTKEGHWGSRQVVVEGDTLVYGSNVYYFKFHQSREPRKISKKTGKERLPRRPVVITEDVVDTARVAIIDGLFGK